MKIRKRWILFLMLIAITCLLSIPELVHENKGTSISTGSVRNGKLENGWLIPFQGKNFHYFSQVSYFILNNAYVHSDVYATIMDAYKACEKTCPGSEFILMECTRKRGGRMLFHWTHQNGVSADFMVPKKKGENVKVWPDNAGLFHYLFRFDEDGKFSLDQKIEIDFETMARHIIAIDDAAKDHGLRIRKILLNTSLHDNLFDTPSGKVLLERDINFIPRLGDFVNKVHDDHYHVDFELLDNNN